MNFYPMHIGDYIAHTAHLEPMEDLAYRRMIDLYYVRECALPADPAEVAKLIRLRNEVAVVASVLSEFFKETDAGWSNGRCDYEIGEAQGKRIKAQASAAKRWDSESNANAKPSHTEANAPNPITNPITNPKKTLKPAFEYSPEFDHAWSIYPARPGASKKDSFKAWSARIADGVSSEAMIDGVSRYAAYCRGTATEPGYVKQPTTFFGPGEHYMSDWTVPAQRAAPAYQSIHDKRADTIAILTGRKTNERTNANEHDITGESCRVA